MKLAITGASGFIGKYIVLESIKQGHSVVAITRQKQDDFLKNLYIESTKNNNINLEHVEVKTCDLNNLESLTQAIRDCDMVIHLAASMHGADLYQSTINSTVQLLKAIHKANIKNLALISSISVLDYINADASSVIDETTPICKQTEAMGDYARMKRDQENLCLQWQQKTNNHLLIIRPGIVYSDDHLSNAHAGFIKKGIGITSKHNGQTPLIKVNDLARKVVALLNQKLSPLEYFHLIGSPPVLQTDYLSQLKHHGELRLYLNLPWKAYGFFARSIRWCLIKTNKKDKIPDSFRENSVGGRTKPFFFSTDKINTFVK